jgi:hypothetical protein
MLYIQDKMNHVNSTLGTLTANEFNSLKNEISNVVKYRNTLNDNDDFQLLRSIINESKVLFYVDNGVVNEINLFRENELSIGLLDGQTFIFNPKYSNTGATMLKINTTTAKPVLLNGDELPSGFLNTEVTYMVVYNANDDSFSIKNLTIGNTSDHVFSDMHNESTFISVTDDELGIDLFDNAVVYIDQNTGKYELAIIENPKTQKQNAIAIYKEIDDKKYVFIDGIVPNFHNNLISGFKYYLSNSIPGNITDGTVDKTISIGRYIKNGKFLLSISGDISIDVNDISFKIYNNLITNGLNSNGVIYTDLSNEFTLMYDTVTFNSIIAKKVMFVSIDNKISKIEYAIEYSDNQFNLEYNGLRYDGVFKEASDENNPIDLYLVGEEIIDTKAPFLSSTNKTFNTTINVPLTLETVTATDNVDGVLPVIKTGTVDFTTAGTYNVIYSAKDSSDNISTITHTYVVSAIITYNVNISNPQTSNGITFTDPSNAMILMFNNRSFDQTTPAIIMFIRANNITAKIDYAVEYTGVSFEIEIDGNRYFGTFNENESYSNPTVMNLK